jgi:hypothetical protein
MANPDNQDGEANMSSCMRKFAAMALVAASIASCAGAAAAMPIADGLALKSAAPAPVEQVRWGGHGWGWGGFAAGAILGGALLAPHYYAPGPYSYGPGPYYAPAPAYVEPQPYYDDDPSDGDPVGYCMQRFRSYDPRSGTYLGYDGYRHPCP